MTWNYRIIKRVNKENNYTYYALNEVFYKETGEAMAFSEYDDVTGETPEEIIEVLKMMLKDAKKDRPVLTEEDFKK
jgi:hypothetical protein